MKIKLAPVAAKYGKVLAEIIETGPNSCIIKDYKNRVCGTINDGVLTPKFSGRQALMGSLVVRDIKEALNA